ncbi:MAG: SH3 domain-containing protein [Anaerolineaceae bacterium]|nr:SH3 domain-containing protein [Anaerolineaceae bacterium]
MRNNDSRWSQYGTSGFYGFLDQLARRLEINVETFLVGSISLLLLSIGLLLDQFPLFVLAILLSPILSPILGFAFGFNLGAIKFLRIGFFSLLLHFVSLFVVGAFSGFIARQFPEKEFIIWQYFVDVTWAGFLLIFVGILIMVSTIIRNPRQASLVANVALAYSFYLPVVSAGFAFGIGLKNQFIAGLYTFLFYFIFAVVIGVIVLLAYRIKPIKIQNWLGVVSLLILVILGVVFFMDSEFGIDIGEDQNKINLTDTNLSFMPTQISPLPSSTSIPLPTSTMTISSNSIEQPTEVIPTLNTSTATITLTPLPVVIWVEIRSPEGDGANIREEPGFSARIIRTVLNGTAVQVLDEVEVVDGATWAHIRFIDQVEGWIMRSLIVSATPEPEW